MRLEQLFGVIVCWLEFGVIRVKTVSFDALCPFNVAVGGCFDGESPAFSSDPISIVAGVCHASAVPASMPLTVHIQGVAFAAFGVVECCVCRVP